MIPFVDSAFRAPLSPVSSDIQHYLAQATLPRLRLAACTPCIPSANHKTHRNNLSIRPERYRRLRHIHRVKRDYLDFLCLEFIKKHIPHTPVKFLDEEPDESEQPSIPCKGFDVDGFLPAPIRNIDGLGVMWLEGSILRTIQAVLNMIPEYHDIVKNYNFTCNDIIRDEDQQIFRYFMWERSEESCDTSNSGEPPVNFILAYQPPWTLGTRDIELFADKRLKHLPPYDACLASGQQRYNSTHKLWAKIWDVCKIHDCHMFVLTNYNQWVFGGFSKGWENGYTMGVKEVCPLNTKGVPKPDPKGKRPLPRTPTILEYLVYWTVSSMHLSDSFEIPPVPDEMVIETAVDNSLDDSLPPSSLPPRPNFYTSKSESQSALERIELSDSNWSSASSDVPSSAGVRISSESDSGQTIPLFLLTDTWRHPTDSAMAKRNADSVNRWLDRTVRVSPGPFPSIARLPSPVQSEWSDRSLATCWPRRHQGFYNLETTIVEEVYEYDFTVMDFT